MTNSTELYTVSRYVRNGVQARLQATTIEKGGQYPLHLFYPGTEVILDGEPAVVMCIYPKSALVRIHSTQECIKISRDIEAVAVRYGGWESAYPKIGDIVEVREGEFSGQIGMVAEGNLNSCHVLLPWSKKVHKVPARNLIIREDVSFVAY